MFKNISLLKSAMLMVLSSAAIVAQIPPATYGPGFGADAKGNRQVHPSQQTLVSDRFRATTSSTVSSVRVVERGGSGYSGGTGGTMNVMIETDDGTSNHFPSGTVLASKSFSPGNPGGSWETYTLISFTSPPSLTAGQLYHVVFQDTDANPDTNFISLNFLYTSNSGSPNQEHLPDDYLVLGKIGSTWSVATGFTAPLDVTYANGVHDGQSYYATIDGNYGLIGGTNQMRETFTVTGGDKTVMAASVRLGKQSGSGALTISLKNSAGTLIEAGTVNAADIITTVPAGGGVLGNWVTILFKSTHVLSSGSTYNLVFSAPSGTQYSITPIRSGNDIGFNSYGFSDGIGQQSTDSGSTWTDLYAFAPENTQSYFTLMPY